MKNKPSQFLLLVVLTFCTDLIHSQTPIAQQTAPPQPTTLPGAESRVYKSIGETKLMLHIFQPPGRKNGERRPAIVFFFGGGWVSGAVSQFVPQSKYLAARGMVAVVADYRVYYRHSVTPFECVADAKSAIRWLRLHTADFGIDDKRIVAAGGSSGGHLAASAALLKGFDEKNEDLKVSSAPNALVLFNPPLDMLWLNNAPADVIARTGNWLKGDWVKKVAEISPILNVRQGAPPTIIFHGTADQVVPFEQATHFCELMKKQRNRCEVVPFEGRTHGFFNYGNGDNPYYRETLRRTDEFLISIGYLNGEPRIR
jgi:acetyl esterase/lipase